MTTPRWTSIGTDWSDTLFQPFLFHSLQVPEPSTTRTLLLPAVPHNLIAGHVDDLCGRAMMPLGPRPWRHLAR